jgi:ribosomal protein S6--L-glutamate ligase
VKRPKIGVWMYRDTGGDLARSRLIEALRAQGAEVLADFDMRRCFCRDGHVYSAEGHDLSRLDLLFHMNFDEQTPYQRYVLQALELSGVRLVNRYEPFALASDKFLTNLVLRRRGIEVPPSLLINADTSWACVSDFFQRAGSVVLKKRFSAGGKGVLRFDELDRLREFVLATQDSCQEYYLERRIPFVERDARVELIGGRCVGAYSRKLIHSYKTNLSFASDITQCSLLGFRAPAQVLATALEAAQAVGVETTVVDLVESSEDGRYYVLEVNCQLGMFAAFGARTAGVATREGFDDSYDEEHKLRSLTSYLLERAHAPSSSCSGVTACSH